MKTIRMPKELLDKWLAALRSGEYMQTAGVLHNDTTGGYCCLGLLQRVVDGDVEREDGISMGLPSIKWLNGKGVSFASCSGYADNSPWLPPIDDCAHTANDEGLSFPEIADAIEACAEGY